MATNFTDGDRLAQMIESLDTEYYTSGTFIEYNGLDVKNLKNPLKS